MAPRPWAPFAAFLACSFIWGSTWLAIKVGYAGVGALTGAALRFGLTAAIFVLVMAVWRIPLPKTRSAWLCAASVAFLLIFADYGLIYWGEQGISSGLTAVLFASLPLLTALIEQVAPGGERMTRNKTFGILVGIVGLAVVFGDSLSFDASRLPFMLAVLGSAFFAGLNSHITHADKDTHPVAYMAPGMALGALLLLGAAFVTGEQVALPADATTWLAVLYLAVFGSVIAFLLYFKTLMPAWGPTKANLLTLLTPLTALALGAVVLGEQIGLPALAGTALVLAGVGITLRSPALAPDARPHLEATAD